MTKSEIAAQIIEVVKEMPGLTTSEISSLMPHANKSTVGYYMHRLAKQGIIYEVGKKSSGGGSGRRRNVAVYAFSDNPQPVAVPVKRKAPTEAALHIHIKELKAQIAELETWKADALSRYPDLAVDPVVLRARKLVADEVRAGGDKALAEQILAGRKDDTLMVRVTVKALEEGV